jgi:4-carboxymuconolactone decarboxylase
MALLPYVDEATAPQSVREILERTQVKINVFRMICNSEAMAKPFARFANTLLTRARLDAKLRELAILRVAELNHSVYEWTQHLPIAADCGVSNEEVAAIADWEHSKCFNELERLVLRLTDDVTRNVKGQKETIEALKQKLTTEEIVELVLSIGFWGMIARLLETLEIDLDSFAGEVNVAKTLGSKKAK